MSRTRLFRNDGEQMFAEDPATLDYVDPGIVLLYADLAEGVVCSYVGARLGQPIQATVEHRFDGPIDLDRLAETVAEKDDWDLTLRQPPEDDAESTLWVLHALQRDPLEVSSCEREIIRELLPSSSQTGGSGGSVRNPNTGRYRSEPAERTDLLDFAVRHAFDAARFFTHLVTELSDTTATIAVSKAGRIPKLAEADIVIHLDESQLASTEDVAAIGETRERIDAKKSATRRQRVAGELAPKVQSLVDTANRLRRADRPQNAVIDDVLQERLNDHLGRRTGLAVVARSSIRRRTVALAFVGTTFGFVAGLFAADAVSSIVSMVLVAGAAGVASLQGEALSASPTTLVVGVVAIASLVTLCLALIQRRRVTQDTQNLATSSLRSDVYGVSAVVSLLVLGVSVLLLVGWV